MSHKNYRHEKICLNCDAVVEDKFCPNCGQENLQLHDNFFHMAGHFLSDYFHFDSKFFRSLIPLFTKPGFLTQQYWIGKRVSYINPLRLFFFITIVFMIGTTLFYNRMGDLIKKEMVIGDKNLAKLDRQQLETLPDTTHLYVEGFKQTFSVAELIQLKKDDEALSNKFRSGVDHFFLYLKYVTFLLLPVYALLFKLLYFRRKTFYVDHLVYTMHLQSFIYCLLMVGFIVPVIVPAWWRGIQGISLLIIIFYTTLSLHRLYKQAWWKTILKSFFATISIYLITAMVMVLFSMIYAFWIE